MFSAVIAVVAIAPLVIVTVICMHWCLRRKQESERQDVSDTSWTLNQGPDIRQTPNAIQSSGADTNGGVPHETIVYDVPSPVTPDRCDPHRPEEAEGVNYENVSLSIQPRASDTSGSADPQQKKGPKEITVQTAVYDVPFTDERSAKPKKAKRVGYENVSLVNLKPKASSARTPGTAPPQLKRRPKTAPVEYADLGLPKTKHGGIIHGKRSSIKYTEIRIEDIQPDERGIANGQVIK